MANGDPCAPGPSTLLRERDIRNDIKARLDATGEFHVVWLGEMRNLWARQASAIRGCAVEPANSSLADAWDAAEGGDSIVNCRITLTIAVRIDDDQVRDETAERLLNVVRNTLNGQRLAGWTNAQFTKIRNWSWGKAVDAERQVVAVLECPYYEPGWAVSDVTE